MRLYTLAFQHRSISGKNQLGIEANNERLEYLGDSILGSIVADYLYTKYPREDEGFLTQLRSRIVSRQSLNQLGKKLGLVSLIAADWTSMRNSSAAGDAFEALVGAIYIDRGFEATKLFIFKRILDWHIDLKSLEENDTDFKSQFINRMQKEKKNFRIFYCRRKSSREAKRIPLRIAY